MGALRGGEGLRREAAEAERAADQGAPADAAQRRRGAVLDTAPLWGGGARLRAEGRDRARHRRQTRRRTTARRGLGGYLAGKTEQEHYQSERKREYYEIEHLRQREIEETKEFFAHLGLSEELQNRATEEISQNPDRWVDFMMKYELDLEAPDPRRATKSALNIGLAYIAGGIIPLSPYFFIDDSITALKYSVVATLICLFVFGYVKSKITGVNPWLGALKVMSIGALAAAAAFGIAKLFEG